MDFGILLMVAGIVYLLSSEDAPKPVEKSDPESLEKTHGKHEGNSENRPHLGGDNRNRGTREQPAGGDSGLKTAPLPAPVPPTVTDPEIESESTDVEKKE